eukprot:6190959-Pleurochrysis_carterae.AAC.4
MSWTTSSGSEPSSSRIYAEAPRHAIRHSLPATYLLPTHSLPTTSSLPIHCLSTTFPPLAHYQPATYPRFKPTVRLTARLAPHQVSIASAHSPARLEGLYDLALRNRTVCSMISHFATAAL